MPIFDFLWCLKHLPVSTVVDLGPNLKRNYSGLRIYSFGALHGHVPISTSYGTNYKVWSFSISAQFLVLIYLFGNI